MMSVLAAAAAPPLVLLSISDFRCRRIPNLYVAALGIIALVRIISSLDPVGAAWDFGYAAAVFVVLLVAWVRKTLGAGDVKVIVAAALLVGHDALLHFLFLTAILGGVLALLVLADSWLDKYYAFTLRIAHPAGASAAGMAAQRPSVPYGIAIAVACLMTLIAPQIG
jgi:prepilin peptidase CpaA